MYKNQKIPIRMITEEKQKAKDEKLLKKCKNNGRAYLST